ncbi:MAG: hypothetical protein ABF586_12100 [Sporolactobacillus sp.]
MKKQFKKSLRWALPLAVITVVLSAIFSIISTAVLNDSGLITAILVVLLIILMALFFDIIGVAATASNEAPFHAMASKRMRGAQYAVWLSKNADRVNTFCTDVIGDMSAIISGTAASVVVVESMSFFHESSNALEYILSVVVTCLVAALTVFVKALGKSFAIKNATTIIYHVGYVIFFAENRLHLPILSLFDRKNRKGKGKSKR